MNKCKICKKEIKGRSDKLFCSNACKNYYHTNLRKVTKGVAFEIDKILHRNRSILLEIIGKHKTQIKTQRMVLDKKKFSYKYHTHINVNSQGKTFYWLYDLAWMAFSNDEILIVKKR
ncbi:MAG: hypothetical protein R2836_07995 [Chitinophagales bacterium]|nr:hypothetical protein [Chitinophagales bacterium]